jgi:hypothetical protein
MLIDLTRRPVRLIFEECQNVVVIRTMRVAAGADGKVHQEVLKGYRVKSLSKVNTLNPSASLPKAGIEFFETILPESITKRSKVTTPRPYMGFADAWEPPPSDEPYFVTTGYDDVVTKKRGQWRINLVISPAAKGTKALNVLDETNSLMLFTIQIPAPTVQEEALFQIVTPLARLLRQDNTEVGMWAALQDDGDSF